MQSFLNFGDALLHYKHGVQIVSGSHAVKQAHGRESAGHQAIRRVPVRGAEYLGSQEFSAALRVQIIRNIFGVAHLACQNAGQCIGPTEQRGRVL